MLSFNARVWVDLLRQLQTNAIPVDLPLATYALFIKDLSLVVSHNLTDGMELPKDLPVPLLPSLHSLRIRVVTGSLQNILRMLLHPSLRKLQIDFLSSPDITTVFRGVPEIMREATGGLENLSIVTASSLSHAAHSELSTVVRSNPHLRQLAVADIGDEYHATVEAAGELSELEEASFLSEILRREGPVFKPSRGFHSLVNFKTDIATESIPDLLQCLESDRLEELTLYSYARTPNPAVHMQGLQRYSSLKLIDLWLDSTGPVWQGAILPLLSCSRMESVEISINDMASQIDDSMTKTMARAWPDLHNLALSHTVIREGATPAATLQGLVWFAVHCPALRCLSIAVDASSLQEGENFEFAAIGFALEELDLSGSHADGCEERIAGFIFRMWPNQTVETQEYHPGEEHRWRRIREIVKTRLADREPEGN